jgi:phage terminase large subunit GpA-like protein
MTQTLAEAPEELWNALEREAWRPLPKMLPSEWAERYRDLPRDQSPRPGPWRNSVAPYLRAIMDLPTRRGVSQLNLCKCAQGGGSEAVRCLIGYTAHLDPDPVGLALPDRVKGRQIIRNRIIPLIRQTPVLRALATARAHDIQSDQISLLNGFMLHLLWSGSASSLASNPMRLAIADEVDKFMPWTGREADPISLIEKRLRAFEDRGCAVNISTPTTRAGKIWELLEGSDVVLYFFVPCPRCQTFQRLIFSQLKCTHFGDIEDKRKRAAAVERRKGAVWYECIHCGGRIEPSERKGMVAQGRWGSEDGSIQDAEAIEEWPAGTRLGLQISALYVPWVSWHKIMADFMRAEGSLAATFDFYTSTLGEPFEQQVDHAPAEIFAAMSLNAPLPEGRLPRWAVKLLCTIDTQADHFYLVLRAWGPGMRSARVWHGRAMSFEELDTLCFRTPWPFEGDAWPPTLPELILIDSGGRREEGAPASRTMEVYRWAYGRRGRVRAIKGASRPRLGSFAWMTRGFLDAGRGRRGDPERPHVPLWMLDVNHFADELAEAIHAGQREGEVQRWWLNTRADDDYNRHMSAARKVLIRQGHRITYEWIIKPSGARHDYWDCEVYQLAAAYLAQIHLLPSDDAMEKFRQQQAAEARKAAEAAKREPEQRRDPWKPSRL